MTADEYWAGLERVGWLAYVPAPQHAELRERIACAMAEHPQFVFLTLSVIGFDGECIMGEGGPNEPLAYYTKLQDFARVSRGRFQPVKIVDHVDWIHRTTFVSFAHNGLAYSWFRPIATDWFQGEVLDLVNKALKESGAKERFIPLPAVDQCWSIAFVPPAVYNKAVRAGLIPTQGRVDKWLESEGTAATAPDPAPAAPQQSTAMTESEWLSAPYDEDMLQFLQCWRKTTPRKIRLFCCALVRRKIESLRHPWGQQALELAERFADGQATKAALSAAHRDAFRRIMRGALPETTAEERRISAATKGATWAAHPDAWVAAGTFVMLPEYRAGEDQYLRDVIGNPFRSATIKLAWLAWNDGAVPKIAKGIYEERAFDRLPVLADALEEAGCSDAAILDHCRGPGPHVRGCWVVDLVLGKK
jgi:hypothetical protein